MNLAILLSAGLAAGEAQAQSLAIRDELSEDQCREALVKEPEAPPECVSDFASLGHFETALNDLPAIQEVGLLRVLTVYSHTNYFLRDGTPDGLEYRLLQAMVKGMNKRRPKGSRALTLVFIPVPFDQLLPLLIAGHGDIAASFLTVAPEREALVSFSRPYWTGVSELLVTGKGSPKARDIADFSGKTVHIVSGTTFETSLAKANDHLKRMKLAPINIVPVGKGVDQEDLLRLVGGGSITATMADSAIARFWAKALGNFQTQDAIPLARDRRIAFAVRKGSPKLLAAINRSLEDVGEAAVAKIANDLTRGINQGEKAANAGGANDAILEVVKRESEAANIDWRWVAALIHKESSFNPHAVSAFGGKGLMQLTQAAADDMGVTDPFDPAQNVRGGVRYLMHLRNEYFAGEDISELDRWRLVLAGYNGGPNRINRLRASAAKSGGNSNVYFFDVENQVVRRNLSETYFYVRTIEANFIALSNSR